VVSLGSGRDNQLVGNDISRGGDLGVHGGGSGNVVRGNHIHHNNTEGFDPVWEAGGLKMAIATDLTLEGNEVYDNAGPGLWCDISCKNTVMRANRAYDNEGAGLFYEISDGARITGNAAWRNGTGRGLDRAAGIMVSNARDVLVDGNTVVGNGHGIWVFSIDRSHSGSAADAAHWNKVSGVEVSGNTIVMEEDGTIDGRALNWYQPWSGGTLLDPASGNRASGNGYGLPRAEDPARPWFTWGDRSLWRMADLDAASGADSGEYLSAAQVSAAVAATTGSGSLPPPPTTGPPASTTTTEPSTTEPTTPSTSGPPTSAVPTTTEPTTPSTSGPPTSAVPTSPTTTLAPPGTTTSPTTAPLPPTTTPSSTTTSGPTAPSPTAPPGTTTPPPTSLTPSTVPRPSTTVPPGAGGDGGPGGSWRTCVRTVRALLRQLSEGRAVPWWWALVTRLLIGTLCRS
jgi:parallel beta-helix repeat protein